MADSMSTLLSAAVGVTGSAGALAVGLTLLRGRDPYRPAGHALTAGHPGDPLRPVLRYGFGGATVRVRPGPRDELFVGAGEPDPRRSLRRLVLLPLAETVAARGGCLHRRQVRPFELVVEFGGPDRDADALLRAYLDLDRLLRDHAGMLTRYDRGTVTPGAVTVLVAGNVDARALLADEPRRYAFADGTLDDVGNRTAPASLVPCLGELWHRRFGWDGLEPITAVERHLLHGLVAEAHGEGRTVRLGGLPHRPRRIRSAFRAELQAARVDAVMDADPAELTRWAADLPERRVKVPARSVRVQVNSA
jgi:hypothetical protein